MGKGKKKTKGKKRSSGKKEKVRDDAFSPEQLESARLAAANRKEDPLKNWTRLQNEECPICMLPIPHEVSESNYCVTCGKTVCWGCMISTAEAHTERGDVEKAVEKITTCPYCQSNTAVHDDKFVLEQVMKRANAGGHDDMCRLGEYYFHGKKGPQQDKAEGLKWYHRAVEAGSGCASFCLGSFYYDGDGVEQDTEKAMEYYQKSADLGYAPSFVTIGFMLLRKGGIEEAMLNFRKAAICGVSDDSIFITLRDGFKCGHITKDEYAFTLREYQAACNEMESGGRERYKKL